MQRLGIFYLWLSIFLFYSVNGQENQPVLEKKLTLEAFDISIAEVFKMITKQSNVLFSYNPLVFDATKKIKLSYKKAPLRLVLDAIIKGTNQSYKVRKNYVIFYTMTTQQSSASSIFKFSGYIYDEKDSVSLEDVSIYIKQHKQSSLSNQFGYFVVQYPKPAPSKTIAVSIAKENYEDTVILIAANAKQSIKVYLKPKTDLTIRTVQQSQNIFDTLKTPIAIPNEANAQNKFIQPWLGLKRLRQNLRNINDTLFSKFSLSLVPLISTNKLLSINTVNNVSLNLLVGYSKGTRIAEFGGILNIDNGSVQYIQAAGVGNVVRDSVRGVQAAGVFNMVNQDAFGLQAAGLFNTVRSLKGVQLAGVFNYANRGNGLQSAGVFNHVKNSFEGVQSAGVFNIAKELDGAQIAGVFNVSDSVKGVQLSGVYNQANTIDGAQISGLMNRAKKVKGLQLSIVNFADTMDGVPIGLFSYVKKGYRLLELSANELLIYNVGFRTGVKRLHNIFSIGSNISGVNSFLAVGYGLGSILPLKGNWSLSADIMGQGLYNYKLKEIGTNTMAKCALGLEYRFHRKLAISIAPSFNLISQSMTNSAYFSALEAIVPHTFYNRNLDDNINLKMWFGFNAAIRLF